MPTPTPHNAATIDQIAPTVLMPGDPLRAKVVAETFLENAVPFNQVRGMLGYTGSYNGKPVSVMGSGMGMPSIGIYSYELYRFYNVENIIRIGSTGAYSPALDLYDVLLVTSSWTESTYAKTQAGFKGDLLEPSPALTQALRDSAARLSRPIVEGRAHCTDVFYRERAEGIPYWQTLLDEKGCQVVDMESFALFHNANIAGKSAACILTISDSLATREETSPLERERSFTNMMEIALGAI